MKTVWFQDLKEPSEREDFKKSVLASKFVLDKAIKIVYTYIKSGEKTKLEDFKDPSWAYKAAFLAGRNSAFNEVIEVLTLDDE